MTTSSPDYLPTYISPVCLQLLLTSLTFSLSLQSSRTHREFSTRRHETNACKSVLTATHRVSTCRLAVLGTITVTLDKLYRLSTLSPVLVGLGHPICPSHLITSPLSSISSRLVSSPVLVGWSLPLLCTFAYIRTTKTTYLYQPRPSRSSSRPLVLEKQPKDPRTPKSSLSFLHPLHAGSP